jgi:hypothetical protein
VILRARYRDIETHDVYPVRISPALKTLQEKVAAQKEMEEIGR